MEFSGARRAVETSEDRNAVAKIRSKVEREGGASSGAASGESERCQGWGGASRSAASGTTSDAGGAQPIALVSPRSLPKNGLMSDRWRPQ